MEIEESDLELEFDEEKVNESLQSVQMATETEATEVLGSPATRLLDSLGKWLFGSARRTVVSTVLCAAALLAMGWSVFFQLHFLSDYVEAENELVSVQFDLAEISEELSQFDPHLREIYRQAEDERHLDTVLELSQWLSKYQRLGDQLGLETVLYLTDASEKGQIEEVYKLVRMELSARESDDAAFYGRMIGLLHAMSKDPVEFEVRSATVFGDGSRAFRAAFDLRLQLLSDALLARVEVST
ncbi:MAG: hypothetical protein AAF515_09060 [Pseudomonadota bacterium]